MHKKEHHAEMSCSTAKKVKGMKEEKKEHHKEHEKKKSAHMKHKK